MKHGRKVRWDKASWLRYVTWHGIYYAASMWRGARIEASDWERED